MNIIKFMGGLGNQMFQYALYLQLNSIDKKTVANINFYDNQDLDHGVDYRDFELANIFEKIELEIDADNLFAKRKEMYLSMKRKFAFYYKINYGILTLNLYFKEISGVEGNVDMRIFKLRNSAIEGYWQDEGYFASVSKELRKAFEFKINDLYLQDFVNKIEEDGHYASVHIRRGDYLKNEKLYGGICTDRYYNDAMNFILKKDKDTRFVFLSDDIEWVKNKWIVDRGIYVDKSMFLNYHDWYDMCIMSHCKYNIIANSSFSWWGAWLNNNDDKIVVVPQRWNNETNGNVVCPKTWIRI